MRNVSSRAPRKASTNLYSGRLRTLCIRKTIENLVAHVSGLTDLEIIAVMIEVDDALAAQFEAGQCVRLAKQAQPAAEGVS
jgi:hypothetical protein